MYYSSKWGELFWKQRWWNQTSSSSGAWRGENNIYIERERDILDLSLLSKGASMLDFHDSYEHLTYKAEDFFFFFRSGNLFSSHLCLTMLNDCWQLYWDLGNILGFSKGCFSRIDLICGGFVLGWVRRGRCGGSLAPTLRTDER